MSPISKQMSKVWSDRQSELKTVLKDLSNREREILATFEGLPPQNLAIKRLELANLMMDMISYNIVISDLCRSLTKVKSENHLNEARKLAYKALIYLEDVVSNFIDVPFSEYENRLRYIRGFPDNERLKLMNKLGLCIQMVIDSLGENSKWKWSYTELRGRYTVVLKNIIDLKKYVAEFDPRNPGYQERFMLMAKAKQMLADVADSYRQKYELTSQRLDDMRLAISYLSALKRIHGVLAEPDESDAVKKKIEVWKAKMEDDSRRQEMKDKREKAAGVQQQQQHHHKKKKGFFGL